MVQKSLSRKELLQNAANSNRRAEIAVALICTLAVCLCVYALKVELYKEHDSSYKALCDLSEWISCSKVFTSKLVSIRIFFRF